MRPKVTPNLRHLFVNVLVATCGFFFTAALLHYIIPAPKIGQVTSKLQFLATHRDEYDTVFVGSSRVYHGIAPSVFDTNTAQGGKPTHSFNFGVDGMSPPEQFYVLDRILEIKPTTWRWVFIELDDVQVTSPQGVEGTERAVYWHDWSRTWIIFRKLLALDDHEKWKRKMKRSLQWRSTLANHTKLLLSNYASIGRVAALLPDPNESDPSFGATADLGPNADGYDPVNISLDSPHALAYESWLTLDRRTEKRLSVDAYADRSYREYASRFQKLGVTPIFIVTPASMSVLPSKFARNPAPIVLAFNDVGAYPSLYRSDRRKDEGHLNAKGAVEFTKILAERFLTTVVLDK